MIHNILDFKRDRVIYFNLGPIFWVEFDTSHAVPALMLPPLGNLSASFCYRILVEFNAQVAKRLAHLNFEQLIIYLADFLHLVDSL